MVAEQTLALELGLEKMMSSVIICVLHDGDDDDDDDDDDMHLERMVAREEKRLACWLLLAAVEAGISKLCILKVKETLVRS